MFEAFVDSTIGKVLDWGIGGVKRVGKWFKGRAALQGGGSIERTTVEGQVAAALERLVRERWLDPKTKVAPAKEWLVHPETQADMTDYVVARMGQSDSLAASSLERMSHGYAKATFEAPQLAEGVVRAAAAYICEKVQATQEFVSANVMELVAEARERKRAVDVGFDAKVLYEAAMDLLNQAPKTANLIEERVPAVLNIDDGKHERKRLDITGLARLLCERRLVVVAGEGGIGKTTALVELGQFMLDHHALPVPLFISAASWSRSNQPLLDYLAGLGGVLRSGIDVRGLSKLLAQGKVAVLVNGWNEIPADLKGTAHSRGEDFVSAHPAVLVVCTSRRAEGPFAACPGANVSVVEFSWERQLSLVKVALPPDQADRLLARLQSDATLRLAARNPLVLSSAVRLAQAGQEIPNSLFELLEAVQPLLERTSARELVLRDSPVWGFHREYLRDLARAMTLAGAVDLTTKEALQVVGSTLAGLRSRNLVINVEPVQVLEALCDTHVLHRDEAGRTVRFAHQRFQEFYAATWLLEQLSVENLTEVTKSSLVRDVFNWPAWTESLLLAANKLAGAPGEQRSLLVGLALHADLTLASELAGAVRMEAGEGAPFSALADEIRRMRASPVEAAKDHALSCMAMCRSSTFAEELTELIEAGDRQSIWAVVNDVNGISVHSFQYNLADRYRAWNPDQREAFVGALGRQPENLPFLIEVAAADSHPKVVERAISTLAWSFPASDAAADAWFAASDDVKVAHDAFHAMLSIAAARRFPEVLKEVQRLASERGADNLVLSLAREVSPKQRGFAVEVTKKVLRESKRHVDDLDVAIVETYDRASLLTIAEEHMLTHYTSAAWVIDHLDRCSADERHAAFDRLLPKALAAPASHLDASSIGSLASPQHLSQILERLLGLDHSSDEDQDTARLLERMLSGAMTDALAGAVLAQPITSDVRVFRRMVEPLQHSRSIERYGTQTKEEPRRLPRAAVEELLNRYWELTESDDVPENGAKAALCVLMAASDPTYFEDRILEGLRLEVRRRNTVVDMRRRQPPGGYGWEFERAAIACGSPMAKRLEPLLSDRDEGGVVRGVMREIALKQWSRSKFDGRLDMQARRSRLEAGRILRQRDPEQQAWTDTLAIAVVSLLETIVDQEVSARENLFHRRWWLMTTLASLPTAVGQEVLKKCLVRPDAPRDRFIYALNWQVSQGANIVAHDLVAALRTKFRERLDTKEWLDPRQDTTLEDLAALHFFIDSTAFSANDLNATVDEWVAKARPYVIAEKLREIGTPTALQQLFRLAKAGVFKHSDQVAYAFLYSNIPSEDLFAMALDGSLFALLDGYHAQKAVARQLTEYIGNNRGRLHEVLEACSRQRDSVALELAVDLLRELPEPDDRSLDYLQDYLDLAGRGMIRLDLHSLAGLFEHREAVEGSSSMQNVSSKACNHLRRQLFGMVTQRIPASRVAADLLLAVESIRFRYGRPVDEPRHPNLASGHAWPQALGECLSLPGAPGG